MLWSRERRKRIFLSTEECLHKKVMHVIAAIAHKKARLAAKETQYCCKEERKVAEAARGAARKEAKLAKVADAAAAKAEKVYSCEQYYQ